MPKTFKLLSARRLPADADIIEHEGMPHARIRDQRGRRLAQDQEIFLRVLALNLMIVCWTLWRFLQSSPLRISRTG